MGNIYVTGSKGFIGKCLMATLPEVIPVHPHLAHCPCKDDTVIHLANRILPTFENYLTCIREMGEILRWSNEGSKIVYISSSVVYMPKPSLYKAMKKACEELCNCYRDKLDISIIRPFNVYGPGQPDSFVVPTIINQVLSGATTIRVQNPDAKRTFVYVSDVVNEIIDADKDFLDVGYYEYSIAEVIKMVMDVTGTKLKIEAVDRHPDNGPEPDKRMGIISMHEGLKQTIKYMEDH